MNIWRKKSLELYNEEIKTTGLKRVLGKWELMAIGIGAIIGAGIFVMAGVGAKDHAGPALALSFVLAGFGCAFAGLCYAEFASKVPVEGSAYAYSYNTMGELFAWIIGWDLVLEYAMGASAVAVGWSGYLSKFLAHFLNIKLPIWLMNDYYTVTDKLIKISNTELLQDYSSLNIPEIFGFNFCINLPAFLGIWLASLILIKGIKEATSSNNILVIIKVAVLLFVVFVGIACINLENWTPFIPDAKPIIVDGVEKGSQFGFKGILSGAAYIFFAYIGFDVVSTSAGEAKNPKKDVPFGIIGALAFCTILFIAVSLVLTGMVPYDKIDRAAPIADAFKQNNMPWAELIISIAAIAGLTSVLIMMLLGQSRVFYAMSKDGLLPKSFSALHSKFKTPYKTSLLFAVLASLVSAFTPINKIADMCNIGTLLAFVMVCIAVMIMRKRDENTLENDGTKEVGFKTPFLYVVAPLGIAFNLLMMLSLEAVNWYRLLIWLGIGFVIYFLYSYHNSNLNKNISGK